MKQAYPKWITPSGGPSLVVWDKATEDRYLGVMAGVSAGEGTAPASAEPPAGVAPEAPAVPPKKKATR